MVSSKIQERPLNRYESDFVNQAFQNDENGMANEDRSFTVQGNASYGSVATAFDPNPVNHADPVDPVNPIQGAFGWIRANSWMLALIYNEFWISASYSLVQPFFPILVSKITSLPCSSLKYYNNSNLVLS